MRHEADEPLAPQRVHVFTVFDLHGAPQALPRTPPRDAGLENPPAETAKVPAQQPLTFRAIQFREAQL